MNKATIFMNACWVGLAGLGIALGGALLSAADGIGTAGIATAILSAAVLLWTRRADEFTNSLWNAGASVAFGTMLLAFPGLPAAEGFFAGLTGNESGQDIPAAIIPVLAIAAFYIGLFAKLLLGDR
ncbi:MAG: hypothetical protein GW858_03850 [Sphingomonadales bacterium]|nr:hypothetical protein [Sphingomonadales bacterium]NCQ20982.1 hypothetical protein [Sphingomonadales bacterium]NCT02740.1 hypothetical protein [Sphingomonadales bacterium]